MELLQDSPPPRSNPLGSIEEEKKRKPRKKIPNFHFFFFPLQTMRNDICSTQPQRSSAFRKPVVKREEERKKWKCSFPMNGVQFFKEKIFCPFVLGFPQLLAAVAHSSSCLSTAVALASRLLVLPRGGDAV